jgi:hypothetical protein
VTRAGDSAFDEYERRRAAREHRLRTRWGRLGGLAVRLDVVPQSERSWLEGAEGERRVAAELASRLDQTGFVLLHDRRVPGRRGNIDHLAIGPGGVTVIDAKNVTGKVSVHRVGPPWARRDELRIGGRERTSLVDGVEQQIAAVSDALAKAGDGTTVRGCLCFTRGELLPFFGTAKVRDVALVSFRGAAKLAGRAPVGAPCDVERVAAALQAMLRPASSR